MGWRSQIESILLGAISLVHVALCRVRYGRGYFAPAAQELKTSPILVIRCEAKLGDNLLNIPFLRSLRTKFPSRSIHLLHHSASRSVYENCPYIDERIEISWPMSSPRTLWHRLALCSGVFKQLKVRARYGLALVPRFGEDFYAPFLAWMSGAPQIVGFSRRSQIETSARNIGRDFLLTSVVRDDSVRHESHRPLQLLNALAGEPAATYSSALEFWYTPQDRGEALRLLAPSGDAESSWVAVAPGAAIERRKWPVESFSEVVRALATNSDLRFMFIGSDVESADCDALVESCAPTRSVNLAGRMTLNQCAAALSMCRLFVGNDSGLLHLAGAVGTLALEISCHPQHADERHANSPTRFGPTTGPSAVLRPAYPLEQRCHNGCRDNGPHCITTVTADSVIHAARSLLVRIGAEHAAGSGDAHVHEGARI